MTDKKTFNKIIAGTVLAFSIFTIPVKAFAIPELYPNETIYQFENTNYLGSGIVHENITIATIHGKYNVNVIRIDSKNQYPELKGIFNPEGLNYRDTVSNMVNKTGAVAGINGDYFDYSPLPTSLGTLINKGEVISSPIMRQYALPTFYLDESNHAKIEYFDRKIYIKNLSQNGKLIYMDNINKISKDFPTLSILDKNFGHQSIGAKFHKDMIEVVVENGIVTEIREGWDSTPIPRDGFVIVGRGQEAEVLKTIQQGDNLELNVDTTPNKDKIKFAIGGGSTILRDGVYVNTNIADSGRNPRTGIGVNMNNDEIILVTVDGRTSTSSGMSQREFSTLLAKLGAYNGLNLDGGGSTTMAIKKHNESTAKVTNKPSGGSQRMVVNGVGVFNNAPAGELDRIEITTENNSIILGSSTAINLKAFDGQNQNISSPSSFTLSVEGVEFTMDGNLFKPQSEGLAKITAKVEHNGKILKSTKTIPIYSNAIDIYTDSKEMKVYNGGSYDLPILKAKDADSREVIIPTRDIQFDLTDNIGEISNGKFISNGNSGFITARFGDGIENIKITVPTNPSMNVTIPKATNYFDHLNTEPITYGNRIIVLSETQELDPEKKSTLYSKANTSNTTISLNGFSEEFNNYTPNINKINSNAGYVSREMQNTKIINIDSKKGSISKTNSYQWIKLKNEINNSNSKNILITTQSSPEGFGDKLETKNLYNILGELKLNNPTKNIFLVHGGGSGGIRYIDGVRYIGLNSNSKKSEETLLNDAYVEFILDGENLKFNYRSIYN